MPNIDALTIQIDGQADGASKSLEKLTKTLQRLEKSANGGAGLQAVNTKLASIQAQINKINTGKFGEVVKKLDSLGKTKVDTALTKSVGNTVARLGIMAISLRTVSNLISGAIKNSLDYMENMNLFTVSMGKYADEAERYAQSVSEIMGIDMSAWIRNQGVFMALTEGFGVVSDRAYTMSKNLTQLGYDLSSFYNLSIEDAFQKLQSGIAGELEPLRRLGVDLSEARLKAIALELGITKVYSTMTQAEKAQLRYHAIMTQTTKAQGDMARTLDAPANQLRILQAAATQAARAIGNVFIPILNAILPYAIAAANAVRIIASAFASLLGFSMPSVDYSGLSGAANAAGELNENLGGAGGSAKELKNVLMGFDEINKLPDASGGGGGGGGGALLDSFNFDLLEYDFLGDAVNSRVQEIMKSIKPMLDFVKRNADDILQIAKAVGVAFLEWKFVKSFVPDLLLANKFVGRIKSALLALTVGVITIKLGFKFTQDFLENSTDGDLDWGSLIASGLTTAFGSAVTGLAISKATGSSKWGWIATGAVLTISAATDIILNYRDILKGDGWDEDNLWAGIESALKLVGAGAAIGLKFGGLKGAAIGGAIGLAVSLVSNLVIELTASKVNPDHNFNTDMLKEKLKIEQYIKEQMQFSVGAKIEALDAQIELSDDAKKNLVESIQEFSGAMDLLKLGVDKEGSVDKAKEALIGADGIASRLNKYLEEEKITLEALLTISPFESKNGDENFSASFFSSYTEFAEQLESSISLLGGTLADLLEKSLTEGLTEKEAALAAKISNMFVNINSLVEEQGIAGEFYSEANKIAWENLDFDTFSTAVDTIIKLRDEKVQKIVSIWDEQKAELEDQLMKTTNYVLPTLSDQKQLAQFLGDDALVKATEAQIKALEATIADWQLQLDNWSMTHSADKLGENLLRPYAESIQKASNGVFHELFSSKKELEKGLETLDWAANLNLATSSKKQYEQWEKQGLYDAQEYARKSLPLIKKVQEEFGSLFKWGDSSGGGGKADTNNTFVTQIEQVATEATEAFTSTLGEGIQQGVNTAFDSVTFGASGGGGNGGGNTGIVAKAQEVGKQTSDAFVGAVEDGIKKVNELGSESSFSGLRTQLNGAATDAKGITEAINEIPTNHAINLYIAGYSTLINRINNIATKVRSISSATINIKIRAGIEPGSKQFLLQLARISPGAALSNKLISLVNMSMFSKGGFPAHGDIFIANENGPELVGRIGNKTAVANEDQIGDTILSYMEQAETSSGSSSIDEERLANVLVRALRSAGVGAVRIDGKDIARSLNRETQRTGHTPLTIK